MKYTTFAIVVTFVLSACGTIPIDTTTAKSSPASRVFAPEFLVPSEDKVQVVVARDAGFGGSGCMRAVYLDGREISAIDNGEKVTLYVTPGRHILGTGPNPNGTALCHIGSDRMRREADIAAELGKPLKYRLAISANGETAIMPTAF